MTQVAILWHMHQPYYEDLVTREHILPWVRLHGLKDYYGMVAMLAEFPAVKVTFNLVPSLLVQLEAFAADRAEDRALALSLKPADMLTAADRVFILEQFFHANRARLVDVFPRYAELAGLRGPAARHADTAGRLSDADFRDLQVWHKLAWIDPLFTDRDARIRALVAKGRDFSEDDKAILRAVELELLGAVIPAYRDAARRGQVELSTSPFYHPILPLLCDSDIFKRTHPDSSMPRHRFEHREDALEQLARARAYHERVFGRPPDGLWPSEGSVSDAMVPLVSETGFTWMATDEQVLARSLGVPFTRDAGGRIDQPERLYRPYRVTSGQAQVACLFRDRALSDLIGFTYSSWPAEAAAADFIERLVEAGRGYQARAGGGEAVVPIILDGENAWEHYEGGGRPFLRALYARLSGHPELRTVTMGEASKNPTETLTGIFPGSWVDADFYIWIGHRDDHLAWSQLAEAREALDAPGADATEADRAQAREEILIAEGSDWFWWYGDDHSSQHDVEFDELFRRHLRNAYRLLRKPVPDELYATNISTGWSGLRDSAPTAWLSPTIDGDETSYFEWIGAGAHETGSAAGAMHQTSQPTASIGRVLFGFDRAHLYVRVDLSVPARELFADGNDVVLKFMPPVGITLSVIHRASDARFRAVRAAFGEVLELAVPLEVLGVVPGDPAAFFVTVTDRAGREQARQPWHRPIEITVPDGRFDAVNWRA